MEEDPVNKGNFFLNQLISITNPTKTEIKDILVKLYADPIPDDYFWILSRQIRFASISDLQTLQKTIVEVLKNNYFKYLSASFALANYSQRMNISISEIGIPSNPEIAISLIQTFPREFVEINLNILLHYLDFPSYKIQKSAASAIVNFCQDRKNLYISALAALSKSEIMQPLSFPFPVKNEDTRNAGIFILCKFLCNEEAPTSLIMDAIRPTLLSDKYKSSSTEAQLYISELLSANPAVFHRRSVILDFVQAQFNSGYLQPEFLSSVMQCYGLWAVKKIGIQLLPKFIEQFDDIGRELISCIIPYLICFPNNLQMSLHHFLVSKCESKPFDAKLIEMTTDSITAIAPTVSQYCGKFMEIAKHTVRAAYAATNLKPLLEPLGPPPPHEVSLVVFLDEEDKHNVDVQVTPSFQSVEVQAGTN